MGEELTEIKYSECAICSFWSEHNKKFTDGNYYCPKHYKQKEKEAPTKRYSKLADKFKEDFQELINVDKTYPIQG